MNKQITLGQLLDQPGEVHFDWRKFTAVRNAQRACLTANSGAGKTHTCRRILEATHGLVPQIILDPEGEFASLREHFPDYLVAGADGDIPLSLQHPAAMAHRIIEERISVVLDLSELKPKEREAFVKGFLDGLIDSPKRLWGLPSLLLIDEAQMFAPEDGEALSKEAMGSFATRSRKRSIASIFATLRLSNFSKQVAATCTNNLVGGCSLDLDMKRSAAVLGFGKADVVRLRELETGEFFVYGPVFGLKGVHRIKVGPVLTGHARAGRHTGKTMAPTAKVKAALAKLAELPKEAEKLALDKAALQARIRELEGQIRAAGKTTPPPAPGLNKGQLVSLEAGIRRQVQDQTLKIHSKLLLDFKLKVLKQLQKAAAGLDGAFLGPWDSFEREFRQAWPTTLPAPGPAAAAVQALVQVAEQGRRGRSQLQAAAKGLGLKLAAPAAPARPLAQAQSMNEGQALDNNQQRILDTIAMLDQRGLSPNRDMVARWLGIHPNGGRYGSNLARLRELGLLQQQGTKLSPAGQQQASPGPTGLDAFKAVLENTQRQIVEVLAADRTATHDRDSLAAALGIHPNGGRYGSNLALLRVMGAIPERGSIQLVEEIFS